MTPASISLAMAATTLALPAQTADPLLGVERTQRGRDGGFGHVKIVLRRQDVRHGGAHLRRPGAGQCRARSGALILDRVAPAGDGTYGKGKIINPQSGRSYSARLRLRGDRRDVGGRIVMICRKVSNWQCVS